MFWRNALLIEAIDWLRSHGYDVVEFEAGDWSTPRDALEDLAAGLSFP